MGVKLRQDNPWLQQTEDGVIRSRNKNISNAITNNGPKIQDARDSEFGVGAGYSDVRVKVLKLPFGMHVRSLPGKRPTVTDAVSGLPASQALACGYAGQIPVTTPSSEAVMCRSWPTRRHNL